MSKNNKSIPTSTTESSTVKIDKYTFIPMYINKKLNKELELLLQKQK